jgi:hypothetical protein
MFERAIEKMLAFTRPIHTISRTYGGLVSPGTSTLFFVNDMGVAVTCKHVVSLVPSAENMNREFAKFKEERKQLANDGKYKRNLNGLELKYKYNNETTVQLKNMFMNCFDKIEQIVYHVHPTLDLAIMEFKGFNKILYNSHATFLKDGKSMRQGMSLCRIGFPFPEFNNFRHDPASDDIEFTSEGITSSPSFPIDGIITRFVGDTSGKISGIEMSTPGLRGQSGGPLFDGDGLIYGMQHETHHLYLGFDIKEKEIISGGKKNKVSNFPFLHVGRCIHSEEIKAFLTQHKISFSEAG